MGVLAAVQVFEDMPQELRSRFWYVLLERPDLAAALMVSTAATAVQRSVRMLLNAW